jgi:(2R)-3-sulfolactate dehydrogenase (NADP+)
MTSDDTVTLSLAQAQALCEAAALRHGASAETARSLAIAAVRAEAEGQPAVGLSHFLDYLDALDAGRIDGKAQPVLTRPAPALILSDAQGGAAHPGFDLALDDLVVTASTFGLAAFVQRNAFTCGALGPFVARLAEEGLVGLAATNGPALMAGSGGTKPVFCTNPLAFAAPVADGPPLLIDQASSATAFVSIRQAAREGRPIPEGWALDADGMPTTDPARAIGGALLAFGGARGANIALMVEILAAGVTGANWSLDAPSFTAGGESPRTGLFVLALSPRLIDAEFPARLAAQLARLAGYGVHVPGAARARALKIANRDGLTIAKSLHRLIHSSSPESRGFAKT